MQGPQLEFSKQLHEEKYRGAGESFVEAMSRVAVSLKDDDEHYHKFRHILLEQRFLPGGRVQGAMGSTRAVTPYNCFVSGTIEDSFVDGEGSIMNRAHQAAATMRMGGGIGYDFSTLRPRGAAIRKLESSSSGPISFMDIYDSICKCVASSGHRRGAQMGVLRIDHPDVEEFIHAKQNTDRLTGFNVSLAITDEFMECVGQEKPFPLRFGGQIYREIDSVALWEKIMRSTWKWAEPGVLFIDRINRMNNLWYCETIAATNPCGEQPLPPFGACLLGSFNLTKYLKCEFFGDALLNNAGGEEMEVRRTYVFDWAQFAEDIPVVVRAMDNIVDRATYPLYEQEKEAKSKRRMGLGVTGLANAIEAIGHPYGGEGFVKMECEILDFLARHAYRASAFLAGEKGPFKLYDEERYLAGEFIETLDEEVRELIRANGIRNSHLTSIAPTGTISLAADNVSSGIEPVFAYRTERILRMLDGDKRVIIPDYGLETLGIKGKIASEVTIQEHLDVLISAAKRVDSSVSKTCNVPADTPWADFKALYFNAWQSGAKGCTTYQVGGERSGIMNEVGDNSACGIDTETGRHECE